MYNPVIDIQQPFGEVLTRGLVPWIRAAVHSREERWRSSSCSCHVGE